MTHLPEKWRVFFNNFENFDPQPIPLQVFKQMKVIEAKWALNDEREYEEANYAVGGGGRS